MSISYPLSLPAVKTPARIVLTADSAVTVSESPWTYAAQVQKFGGQRWGAQITYPIMTRADAAYFFSFLLKLNGQEGTFLLGDNSATSPQGSAGGTPVVNGASQSGQSLLTRGWTNGVTNILKAGDYLSIAQRLYMNLNDVNSDGSGHATLDIWPALRGSLSDGASIGLTSATGLFRLASNSVPILDVNPSKTYSVSFSAIEAV